MDLYCFVGCAPDQFKLKFLSASLPEKRDMKYNKTKKMLEIKVAVLWVLWIKKILLAKKKFITIGLPCEMSYKIHMVLSQSSMSESLDSVCKTFQTYVFTLVFPDVISFIFFISPL